MSPTSGPDASSATRSERLAELVCLTQENRQRSAFLIRRAEGVCVRLGEAALAGRAHRGERLAWAGILACLVADPDHKVVLCAQCHRAKADERWTALPDGIERELRGWDAVLLSHGYCPDCLQEMEAAVHGA
jgi:hypothetical protein